MWRETAGLHVPLHSFCSFSNRAFQLPSMLSLSKFWILFDCLHIIYHVQLLVCLYPSAVGQVKIGFNVTAAKTWKTLSEWIPVLWCLFLIKDLWLCLVWEAMRKYFFLYVFTLVYPQSETFFIYSVEEKKTAAHPTTLYKHWMDCGWKVSSAIIWPQLLFVSNVVFC